MVGKKWGASAHPVRDLLRMTTAGLAPNEQRMNPRPAKQFWLKSLRAHWDAALTAWIPIGYEDGAGFHYGSEQATHRRPRNLRRTTN
jgi:hypothetical protein